jgi:uncharacterized damage-inducible protein DinB
MTLSEQLAAEFKQETGATRRVLERVPDDRLDWRPHPKSMTLGQLALHVATSPGGVASLLAELEHEAPTFEHPPARSRADIIDALDASADTVHAALAAWSDADLLATWRMTRGGQTVLTLPRIEMVRSIMFNHTYHHRGELMVYLRLLDVPLPPVYGPTADETPFAAGKPPAPGQTSTK